jgi:hypothetical protein
MPINRVAGYDAVGYESLSITGTAGSLTGGVTNAKSYIGVLETAQIRFRTDGSAATASEGILMEVGDTITLSEDEITNGSFIRTGGTSGTLKGTYYDQEPSL